MNAGEEERKGGRERERGAGERCFIYWHKSGGERRVCGETTIHVSHVHIRVCVHVPRDALWTCVIMGNVALISLHAGFPCLSLCRDTACTNKTHTYVPRPGDQSHTRARREGKEAVCISPGENVHYRLPQGIWDGCVLSCRLLFENLLGEDRRNTGLLIK